jgi:glycosyltransferase involved in cell wall biosynthesis
MKIGIEAQRLFRSKKHGMDRVALELIRNLQEIDFENEYYVFVKSDEDNDALKETRNFKIVQLDGHSYPYWEQFILPKVAKKYGCEILHCTSNTAPIYPGIPLITTLHDIIYLERSWFKTLAGSASAYQKFGNIYRQFIVPFVVKNSSRIITVSHFEKNNIGEYFHMNGDNKLKTVHNGVSKHFKVITDKMELKRVKEKYHLPDHFLFFLGNSDPRKNTKGTLKAFSDFLKQTNSNYKLVMLDFDSLELKKILREIGDDQLFDKIIMTGYVQDNDLPAIYSLSELFLFPSLREGFGIPVLEAMACGVPVITSNTSSMPEIAGDAAHLVNPSRPQEITQGIRKILSDKKYSETLCKKGLEQHKKFSWKSMAENVLELYSEMYSEIKTKNYD